MFPIRDDNPQLRPPIATYMLIAINVAVWAFVQGFGNSATLVESICQLGLIPGELLGTVQPGTEIELGQGAVCRPGDGAWYTVFTSMFMHGGWMHIIGNMWFLFIFGGNVEDSMGPLRFTVFYLACGLAAAAAQVATNVESVVPMVGASGAIGGVMGAYIVLYPRVHVHMLFVFGFFITTFAIPAIYMLGYWFLIQLLSGVGSLGGQGGGVAFWAHVGGFAAGATLVWLFRDAKLLDRHPYHGFRQPPSPTQSWHRVNRR